MNFPGNFPRKYLVAKDIIKEIATCSLSGSWETCVSCQNVFWDKCFKPKLEMGVKITIFFSSYFPPPPHSHRFLRKGKVRPMLMSLSISFILCEYKWHRLEFLQMLIYSFTFLSWPGIFLWFSKFLSIFWGFVHIRYYVKHSYVSISLTCCEQSLWKPRVPTVMEWPAFFFFSSRKSAQPWQT